jgi:transcriptional regulator with XRE-family HTH domain
MTSGRGAYQAKKPDWPLASLGQRIRAVRIAWGWTQGTLAKALGSAQSLVSEWEKDISKPSGASLTALARLYHSTTTALSTGKDFKVSDPPDTEPWGGQMSKRAIQELKQILPVLKEGEILQVNTMSKDSELVPLKEAMTALKAAQSEGRPVWLVIGNTTRKKK